MINGTSEIKQRMQRMAEELKQKGLLRSPLVETAFSSVPRHLFINRLPPYLAPSGKDWIKFDPFHAQGECLYKIYSADTSILLKANPPTSSSAPSVMAGMLEELELAEGMKVLEIGTGSGYNAALLAHIVGEKKRVYTIENQPDVAKEAKANLRRASFQGVEVICADGGYGHAPSAPYHRVLATASIYDVPTSWREQLIEGGILVAPVWMAPGWMPIVKLVKQGETLSGRFVGGASFMALQGDYGYDEIGRVVNADNEERLAKLLEHPIEEDIELPIQVENEKNLYFRFMEFNAFVNLEEHRAIGLKAPSRKKMSWLSLWDREAYSLVSSWMPDWRVGVYGSEAMYVRLLELLNQWKEMGAPKISSYKVSIFKGKLKAYRKERNTFFQSRLWNTWEFSLTI